MLLVVRMRLPLLVILVLSLATTCRQTLVVDPATYVVGGRNPAATSNCTQEIEAVASRTPTADEPFLVAGHGIRNHTEALGAWDQWDADAAANRGHTVPIVSSQLSGLGGDAWTTYSHKNNIVYASFIGRKPGGASCFAVAGTVPSLLDA